MIMCLQYKTNHLCFWCGTRVRRPKLLLCKRQTVCELQVKNSTVRSKYECMLILRNAWSHIALYRSVINSFSHGVETVRRLFPPFSIFSPQPPDSRRKCLSLLLWQFFENWYVSLRSERGLKNFASKVKFTSNDQV